MNARSALFDLYGDHLRSRGGSAPVAALVKLLAPLGIASPAVRTAISRLVRQHWLAPVRLDEGPGYRLTVRAERRLGEAANRIYRSGIAEWDSHWHVVVLDPVVDRAARERLRTGMAYLGYAPLRDTTWVSPRPSGELDSLLETEQVRAQRFSAEYDGDDAALTATAWDLQGLGRSYDRWLQEAKALVSETGHDCSDQEAFVTRTRLVHEWRKFLFRDPGLPVELLPPDWAGQRAAAFFDAQATRLLPGTSRYVDACLRPNGDPR
jgi:phenylacetic acid degradation operon negative regulatory protein